MKNDESDTRNINRLESICHAHSVKKEERTDRMEDYLEAIYELIKQKGYATPLNVSSPSVTKMVQRLYEQGYLNYEKYRGISLTPRNFCCNKYT